MTTMDYALWDLITEVLEGTAEGALLFVAHPMFNNRYIWQNGWYWWTPEYEATTLSG